MNEARIATRSSPLALAQARRVAELLLMSNPDRTVRLVEVETTGDQDRTSAIASLTESGAFVRAVQEAVLEDRADVAVHSLKDLPVSGPTDLDLVALPERVSPFDVLVGSTLADVPIAGSVGTGSPRRSAQLHELRPDLSPTEIRGNVDTRIRKVAAGHYDAAVFAEAGLERLDKAHLVSQRFDVTEMVPAPGQGALAVEARRGSAGAELGAAIDDTDLRPLLETERRLLAETGAGCRSALGALASWDGDQLRLDVFVSDERGARRTVVFGSEVDEAVSAARRELRL